MRAEDLIEIENYAFRKVFSIQMSFNLQNIDLQNMDQFAHRSGVG